MVTLKLLILNHTWGRSYWRMAYREYVRLCIHIVDSCKMLVRRCPVFVRPFLFQILFLYSFSSLLVQFAGLVILCVVFRFFGYKHIIASC